MRDIVGKLMDCDDANRFMGGMMSGLAHRYHLGSDGGDVGRLVGNRSLGHGSLYNLMQGGTGVFLDASPQKAGSKLVTAFSRSVPCVAVDTGHSMLIRPDACIAWVGEKDSISGLSGALDRWCVPDQG